MDKVIRLGLWIRVILKVVFIVGLLKYGNVLCVFSGLNWVVEKSLLKESNSSKLLKMREGRKDSKSWMRYY